MTLLQSRDSNRLIDSFNRQLNYLRISVTDRCNLRCIYCSPKGIFYKHSHHVLSYEELLRIISVGVSLGVTKVRITGGEPLVRKGIGNFLYQLCQIQGLKDISLTTNGVFLLEHLESIQSAGIRRINISLDTLNPKKYLQITGKDFFHRVWDGIMAAHQMGFFPIKINTVALRGINDDELLDIARLSVEYPFHIRFIEYMPLGTVIDKSVSPLLADEIIEYLCARSPLLPISHDIMDGPAERYKFGDAKGEVGFIRPLSHHFCDSCNRLRLTATGKLRLCLLSDIEVDIKQYLRTGCTDTELAHILVQSTKLKPQRHTLDVSNHIPLKTQMNAIGG